RTREARGRLQHPVPCPDGAADREARPEHAHRSSGDVRQCRLQEAEQARVPAVLDRWDLPESEVVMIGDSRRKDVAAAQALGMKGVWFRAEMAASGGQQPEWLPEPVSPD